MKNELVLESRPKSNISEDIRTIRTNLQFTSSEDDNVFLVTSSVPGEGKSFISSNLAVAFAQTGKKTLIIDSDLRLGRIHKVFEVSNQKGLSNLVISNDLEDCIHYIKPTNVKNLYVIPRGIVPPNPSELLNSNNMKGIIKYLKKNFDYIIVDCVPVNGLPDALIMSGITDMVIIVTSLNYTTIDELNNTKKAIQKTNAKIAGVVVNRTEQTKRGRYSNYYE